MMHISVCDRAKCGMGEVEQGRDKQEANSMGSVMPVKNEVRAAGIMMPPDFFTISGRAACTWQVAAAGNPNILNR